MKKIVFGIPVLMVIIITASCSQNIANIRDTVLAKNFSDKIVEAGRERDHSLIRLILKRNAENRLIVTAEAWGISETGPFIRAQRQGLTLVFSMLAHCGTIESSTPVKIREIYVLTPEEEHQIMNITFKHNNQFIVIEK